MLLPVRLFPSLRKLQQQFDWPLAGAIAAIIAIGLVNLYSATRVAPGGLYQHQLAWFGVGLVLFVITSSIDYRAYERLAYALYGIGIVLLVAVLVGGKTVKGSSRWLSIGPLGIQPSELAKLAVIIALAKIFSGDPLDLALRPWTYVAGALGLLSVPMLLVMKQPDLGTALILYLVGTTIMMVMQLQLHVKLLTIGLEVIAGVILFLFKLHGYQKKRLLTFIDPSLDPSGAGWHARQAIFAVGSGRWTGKGWLHGTQNQLQFLPEHWTDFPFAVWAEEWGFLGCLLLLGCYLFLILWALNLAAEARDRFAQVVCVGCAALIFWHVFFNIGMVAGLLPVVGVTLPLFSYGGSSLLTVMVALGLLMNVSIRRYAY
jgi:rod shape determining protein RodA